MGSRIVFTAIVAAALVSGPMTQVQAKEKVLASGACALAIAATALTACKFGASVENKTCAKSGLKQVRSACGKLSECKGDCKGAYKKLKAKAKTAHRACKKRCSSRKRFVDRFKCKRACGKVKKTTIKDKKKARSACKKACKKNYNMAPCYKARAKLVAWAAGMGASFAAIVKYCGTSR